MVSIVSHLILPSTRSPKLTDRELGGKAWNLLLLEDSGFPVPPWCALSTRVFNEAIGSQRSTIERILAEVNSLDQPAIERASSHINEIVLGLEIQNWKEFLDGLERYFGKGQLTSVRSSVVGEDSEKNSFAGQMDSFLNVPLHRTTEAIKKVWASALSPRALAYRKRKGISLIEISTAVIIQKMVHAYASGVLFTRDHENWAKQCVISAGFGLGEGVVANKVETDTYRIRWHSGEISKDVAIKDNRIVRDTTSQGGTRLEGVPAQMKSQAVLTDAQIRSLRDLGVKVQRHFGAPQDIEWAFDEEGHLYVLQTRPIIKVAHRVAAGELRIWDNSNIVESYPGLTLPLTFTFARYGYENNFRRFTLKRTLRFLPFKHPVKDRIHIFRNLIGLLDGRVYYNLLNWYEMLSFLPGFNKRKDAWDRMIGISHRIDFPQNQLPRLQGLCSLIVTAWKLLTVRCTATKFFAHFDSVYRHFKDTDLSAATEAGLIRIYESLAQKLTDKWHLTLDNDISAMIYYDWLKRLCHFWGMDGHTNLHNDLLCGEIGVESVAPVHSLVHLAEIFHPEPLYQTLIQQKDDRLIWQQIRQDLAYREFKEALENHVEAFGDRGLEELKLERPSLREQPEALIGMIRNYFRLGLTVETMEQRELETREAAEKFVRGHLKNPFKRLVFSFVLRQARRAIVNRENMRFARSRVFGLARKLFRRMGDLFAQKGLIESTDDIFYLTVDEIFSFVQGTAVTQNLKALVEIRKAEYAEFAKRIPKDRFQTTGIPYLKPIFESQPSHRESNRAKGIGCSSGTAAGKACVILDPQSHLPNGGQILVAKSTDPGWVFLMVSSKGIVVEKGSILSHTAIIGRELGIPTIVSVKDATAIIPNGAALTIDGGTGELLWQPNSSASIAA